MGLARELVELEERLRNRGDLDPFLPVGQGGIPASADCAEMTKRLAPREPYRAEEVLRLCLQVLRVQHDLLRPHLLDAELVATLPPGTPGIARPTEAVIREIVTGAKGEIILLGYEFTDPGLVQLLAEASRRGIDLAIICDRGRGVADRIREAWPAGHGMPQVFHDRERPDGAPYASMHAKCVLVDARELLVTSANFTFHGLRGNIETGVRLSGEPAAEARKIFSHLVEHGVVEPVGQ